MSCFILAPIVTIIGTALITSSPSAIFVALPAAYVLMALLGVPVFLLFKRLGWLALWQAPLAGVVAGLPILLVYAIIASDQHLAAFGVHNLLIFLAYPVGTAVVFWVIAVPGVDAPSRQP
jgi:hypothetical protein